MKKNHTATNVLNVARNQILAGMVRDILHIWYANHDSDDPDFDRGEKYQVMSEEFGTGVLADLEVGPGYGKDELMNLELLGLTMDDQHQIKILFAPVDEDIVVCEKSTDDVQISLELLAEIADWLESCL